MIPRLKNSKKWTALPAEFTEQVQEAFKANFKTQAANGRFFVEGRLYPKEILFRVGYLEKGRLKQANMEISVDFSPEDQVIKKLGVCVDATGSLFLEYFQASEQTDAETLPEETLDLPATWKEFPFEGETIFMQFTTFNSSLESEADKLLGLSEKNLLNTEEDEESDLLEPTDDPDASAEDDEPTEETMDDTLGEPSETSGPQMFGPKKAKKTVLH